ncbi:hypothetical protein FIU65_15270, partial [Enterococcus faecium]
MENKTLKIVLTAVISVSLIGNIALFWQLKEEQETNTFKIEEVAKNASEKLKKNSSEAQAKIDKLNQTINEKNQEIEQLKQQDGTKAKEEVTEAQSKTAEEFGKLAIDKSLSRNELTEKLKDVATQEVIDKLSPADDDHQHDDYGSYSFTLGDVQTYAQTSSVKEEQNFVVFVDYTIGNPQFKDVKP